MRTIIPRPEFKSLGPNKWTCVPLCTRPVRTAAYDPWRKWDYCITRCAISRGFVISTRAKTRFGIPNATCCSANGSRRGRRWSSPGAVPVGATGSFGLIDSSDIAMAGEVRYTKLWRSRRVIRELYVQSGICYPPPTN
jgi:hypothetical protein